jgi:hypothetical protein
MLSLLLAAVLSSNASGKQLVRSSPGTMVQAPSGGRPIISDALSPVAHLWVNKGQIRDTRGAIWTEVGSIPRVAKEAPRPEGLGFFTTSNYLTIPTAGVADVGTTDSLTIDAIVLVTTAATPAADTIVWNHTTASASSAGIDMSLAATGARLQCRAGDGATSNQAVSASSSIVPGAFMHLACVYTRSGADLIAQAYVNGLPSGAPVTFAGFGSITGFATIKAGTTGAATPWRRYIYEVAFWKRALSSSEIQSLYALANVGHERIDMYVARNGDDTAIQRVPAMARVRDGRLLLMWEQIRTPNAGDAEGVRLVQAFADYDVAGRVLSVGPREVFEEPAQWTSLLGFVGHPMLTTLPSGRIVVVYNVNDGVGGTVAGRILNVYERHSDDGGETWSTRQKVLDSVNPDTFAALGTTGSIMRIPSGPNAGRLVAGVYRANGGPLLALFSDDDGETWGTGSEFTPGANVNENSVVWISDGSLLMSIRTEGAYQLAYATSADGGETWTYHGARADWQSSNCASSFETAINVGAPELLLWSGLDNAVNFQRSGLVLRLSQTGIAYHWEYRPIPAASGAGYSHVRMLDPNTVAVFYENGNNTGSSVLLHVVTLAEVYREGSPHS